MAKYQLNKSLNTSITRTIEADSYKFENDFFHFYVGHGLEANQVFSVAASKVSTIERLEDSK